MSKLDLSTINSCISYIDYQNEFKKLVFIDDTDLLNEDDKKYYDYRKLNLQRTSRVEKTFSPSEETKSIFSSITNKQEWYIITESWCGDSAQSLPVIAGLASLSDKVELKIILRDSNPSFMDLYLTNGNRSIPKLIVFDEFGSEIFQWGPRPKLAQDLFNDLKTQGLDKTEINKELHLWYAKNRGKEVEKEIMEMIKNSHPVFEN